MRRLAHIVNLFTPPPGSDLHLAQEVTIETMLIARREARDTVQVELLSAQTPSDLHLVPPFFKPTEPLERSVLDLAPFETPMELPILKDILDRLYHESDAEYLIFTNLDIGLQPHFYTQVNAFIDAGHDAFMINRRRIPARFHSVHQLQEMYAEKGKKHPGFDCFVFHRDLYPRFSLAQVCTGVPFVEITLSQNLFCFASNPKVYTDEFLTFHIGMEIFNKRAPQAYFKYNRNEFWKAMRPIWNELDTRKWPNGDEPLPIRFLKWGLHPCFPIRLAARLEPRRWRQRNRGAK